MIVKIDTPELPPDSELIDSDGENLDSNWHCLAMYLLMEVARWLMGERRDYFIGGNMFIYFNADQARNRDFRGPDFFFVEGVRWDTKRRFWVVWNEGNRYPDVIIELLSETTAELDRTVKKDVYEKTFRTHEYFCYDPDGQKLEGWRLVDGSYTPIASNPQGRMWSEKLQAWLGTWRGTFQGVDDVWPRFFSEQGELVPTDNERAEAALAENARLKAELAAGKSPKQPKRRKKKP